MSCRAGGGYTSARDEMVGIVGVAGEMAAIVCSGSGLMGGAMWAVGRIEDLGEGRRSRAVKGVNKNKGLLSRCAVRC
jgi:hypothetical protein